MSIDTITFVLMCLAAVMLYFLISIIIIGESKGQWRQYNLSTANPFLRLVAFLFAPVFAFLFVICCFFYFPFLGIKNGIRWIVKGNAEQD